MNVFGKFDEIPSMTHQDIKKTKRYGHTFVRLFVRSFGRTDNVKTVEKKDNKQCLLDTPRSVTVNNKRLISKCKKSEKKYAYLKKAMALLRITKRNYSNSIGS